MASRPVTAPVAEDALPPHNIEAEEAVIGAMLFDPDALAKVSSWLLPEDFFRGKNRVVYEAALRLQGRNIRTDPVSLATELSAVGQFQMVDPSVYFTHLVRSIPESVHIVYWGELIQRAAQKRRGLEAAGKVAAAFYDPDVLPADALAMSMSALIGIGIGQVSGGLTANDAVYEGLAEFEAIVDDPSIVRGTPSPWHGLTNLLVGGFRKGWLIELAARPGMSKTRIAGQCLLTASMCGWAYFASLEMRRMELLERFAAMRAGVNWSAHVAQTKFLSPDERDRMKSAYHGLGSEQFIIDDRSHMRLGDIWAEVERVKVERGEVSLVVIDYLALVQPDSSRVESEAMRVEQTARGAKQLARALNVPVLLLHQINRHDTSRPTLEGLRYGGEQDPDVVLYAYDEDKALATGAIKQREQFTSWPYHLQGRLEIGVLKQRHGAGGRVWLHNDAETGRLEELTRMEPA